MNKKTSLSLLSVLVALAAMVLIPLNVELTASVIFATGLVALVLGEYTREIRPLPVATPVSRENSALRLAA